MWNDPVVAEVRQTREALARQFDFDISVIFADLRQRQTLLASKLVRRQKKVEDEQARTSTQKSQVVASDS